MIHRTVHQTMWLKHKIAYAVGDVAICVASSLDAEFVRETIHKVTPKGKLDTNFRVIPLGVTGFGRAFDALYMDESVYESTDCEVLKWFQSNVFTRLKSGGIYEYYPRRTSF